jgi:hypothetical protein
MNERLGLEEYSQYIYENISKIIINRNYIEQNDDFFNEVVFKMWEEYYTSVVEPISIMKQLKHFEMFLGVMLKTQPSLELPEDSV